VRSLRLSAVIIISISSETTQQIFVTMSWSWQSLSGCAQPDVFRSRNLSSSFWACRWYWVIVNNCQFAAQVRSFLLAAGDEIVVEIARNGSTYVTKSRASRHVHLKSASSDHCWWRSSINASSALYSTSQVTIYLSTIRHLSHHNNTAHVVLRSNSICLTCCLLYL